MSKKKLKESTTSSKPRINGAKKGKQFEREVSNALGHIWPSAERMLEYQSSGNIGVDIKGTGDFKIQCKRNAGYASISKIHEIRSPDKNAIPILVTKGNRMEAMAVLPFDKFIYMLEVMHGLQPLLKKPKDNHDKEEYSKSETEGNMNVSDTTNKHEVTFLGLPVFELNSIEPGEIIVSGRCQGVVANRYINSQLRPEKLTKFVQDFINIVKEKEAFFADSIGVFSFQWIQSELAKEDVFVYPVGTPDCIGSINDLI